jgi:hypothetical protein
MGDAGTAEEASGEELVVGREERRRFVQDGDTPSGERAERPESVVDAVERRQDVQAPERGVTRLEHPERVLRAH